MEVTPLYSYSFGRSDKTLRYESLGQVLESTAGFCPKSKAVISLHEGVERTFEELNKEVDSLSKVFTEKLFVTKGDVIAIMTANTYKFVTVQYSCAKLGAILCPINAYYKERELEFCLLKVNPKVILIPGNGSDQEKCINHFYSILSQLAETLPTSLEHVVLLDGTMKDASLGRAKVHMFDKLLAEVNNHDEIDPTNGNIDTNDSNIDTNNNRNDPIDPDSTCALFFTSGTTGPPKAAMLSHFNLTNNTRFNGERLKFGLGRDIRICLPVPIFHVFGSVLGTITMATCGVTLVMPDYRYNVKSVVEAIVSYECSHFMGVPAMLIDIMDYAEDSRSKVTSLKGVITAATTVPYEVVEKFRQVIPSVESIDIIYGATETSPIITAPKLNDGLAQTLDNVGVALDFVEVKIVDKASRDLVKIGETGELLTRGPHIFLGYWGDDIQTRSSVDSRGWYSTGDLATMDKDGYIRIVGRTKEIIIRGGMNIYPKEIEEVLISHPFISLAAVCGVPDERLGEDICAWIKFRNESKKLTEDQVITFCKEKMAYFKVPRRIIFVTEFPATASGKVQKFRMKEISCEILGIKI